MSSDSSQAQRRFRILIADDQKAMLLLVRSVLEPRFEVIGVAYDGWEFLEMAERYDPDACVVDISMPLMGGIEASRRLLTVKPDARIVFLSGHEDPIYRDEALALGAHGYVFKRSLRSDLIPALQTALAAPRKASPDATARPGGTRESESPPSRE